VPALPRILDAGDSAIVVEYGRGIDAAANARVRRLDAALRQAPRGGILETVPAYCSLLVHYDPLAITREALERSVREADGAAGEGAAESARTITIPVAYGGAFGPDLADVAAFAGLTEDAVAAMHAAGRYRVFMLGFMPGFPYLGGLPPRLAAPRLATPRTLVPGGSVGIAGEQTGVYPADGPGGWRIVGRTPIPLFDARQTPAALIDAGDRVRFVAIASGEFDAIARRVRAGAWRRAEAVGNGAA